MPYRHIIEAIDVSDEARQVLDGASLLARQHGARLSLVSVVQPLDHAYGDIEVAAPSDDLERFEAQAEEQVRARLESLAASYGIAAEDVHVPRGSPAQRLRALADACHADLIVVGTHGGHGLSWIIGATANAVLHGVHCDVLSVRIRDPGAR